MMNLNHCSASTWRFVCVCLSAILALMLFTGQDKPAKPEKPDDDGKLTARQLRIVDAQGNVRIMLNVDKTSNVPYMDVRDAAGKTRLRVRQYETGNCSMQFVDEQQVVRGRVHQLEDGRIQIIISDKSKNGLVALTENPDGLPSITLYDNSRTARFVAQVLETGQVSMEFHDSDGHSRLLHGVGATGLPVSGWFDKNKKERVGIGIMPDGKAYLFQWGQARLPSLQAVALPDAGAGVGLYDKNGESRAGFEIDAAGKVNSQLPTK